VSDEEVEIAMRTGVEAVLSESGLMTNRWLMLADVVQEDGERVLWSVSSEGMKSWDSLGMLKFAEHVEMGATVRGDE
jgi:hypothetical protein